MTVVYLFLWPLVSALLLFAFGKNWKLGQWANLVFHAVWGVFVFQAWQLSANNPPVDGFPVYFTWNWLPQFSSSLALGIDGMNLPLIALNFFLSLLLSFYCLGKSHLGNGYLGLFSILNAASVGSLLAVDAFVFYIFWEFMLIPMYFLIGKWGSKGRLYAALKFFAFTMAGSLLMLAAIVYLASQGNSLLWHDIKGLGLSFDGWSSPQGLVFLAFLAAFAVKIPVWPLHTWLPDAHTEAPTGASVILAGVLLKLGVYGIARWCLALFPEASQAAAGFMLVLGCAGIVLGSFSAWKQVDIKRAIAYSSVAHLGFMVLGLFSGQPESLQGAMFQNLAHGLSTGALFLIFGIVYDRTHTRDLNEYGGLASKNAFVGASFVFATMASIGLPGLPGFIGEFLILSGTFFSSWPIALVALSGVLLGACYMLKLLRKMVYGPQGPAVRDHEIKLTWNEYVAVVPLLLAMLYLGFQPQGLLYMAQPSIEWIVSALR